MSVGDLLFSPINRAQNAFSSIFTAVYVSAKIGLWPRRYGYEGEGGVFVGIDDADGVNGLEQLGASKDAIDCLGWARANLDDALMEWSSFSCLAKRLRHTRVDSITTTTKSLIRSLLTRVSISRRNQPQIGCFLMKLFLFSFAKAEENQFRPSFFDLVSIPHGLGPAAPASKVMFQLKFWPLKKAGCVAACFNPSFSSILSCLCLEEGTQKAKFLSLSHSLLSSAPVCSKKVKDRHTLASCSEPGQV